MKKELEKIFSDPILAWVNPESTKKMSEVVRDVFPNATKNEICACLEMFWEEKDTPETLYDKLMKSKVAGVMSKLDKLVAANTLSANLGIMQSMKEKGDTSSVLFILLNRECERIVKRYPSLRGNYFPGERFRGKYDNLLSNLKLRNYGKSLSNSLGRRMLVKTLGNLQKMFWILATSFSALLVRKMCEELCKTSRNPFGELIYFAAVNSAAKYDNYVSLKIMSYGN